jgi:hypothetical protein
MKKIMLALMAAIPVAAVAQSSLYLTLGGGYYLPIAKHNVGIDNLNINPKTGDYEMTPGAYSMQYGPVGNVILGCNAGKNVAFEMGIRVLVGVGKEVYYRAANSQQFIAYSFLRKATSISLTPAIRIQVPLSENVSFYMRNGIILPAYTSISTNFEGIDFDENNNNRSFKIKSTTRHKLALGYASALGFKFRVAESFNVCVDANIQLLNVWARKETINTNIENGMSKSLTKSESETEYVRKLNSSHNMGGAKRTEPTHELTYSMPINGMGLQVALQFDL